MKENTRINTEPDMAPSKGPDNPDMKAGYSQGELRYGSSDSHTVKKSPYEYDGPRNPDYEKL